MTGDDVFRDLQEIDTHEFRIESSPVQVWQALVDDFRAQPAVAARYAQLVGADPQRRIGCLTWRVIDLDRMGGFRATA